MTDPTTGLEVPDPNATANEALGTLGDSYAGGGTSPFPLPSPVPEDYPAPAAQPPLPGGVPQAGPTDIPGSSPGGPMAPELAPGMAGSLGQQRVLADQQEGLFKQGGDLLGQKRELDKQKADEKVIQDRLAQQDRLDAEAAHQKHVDDATAEYRDAVGRKRNADAAAGTDYFAGRGFGARLGAAIEIALGGWGAALQNVGAVQAGHAPTATNLGLEHVKQLMADDYKRKRDAVESASEGLVRARTGIHDAEAARAQALKDVETDAGATWSAIEDQFKARGAALGIPAAQLETSQAIVSFREARAAAEQKAIQEAVKEKQQQELADKRLQFQENSANRRLDLQERGLNRRAGAVGAREAAAGKRAEQADRRLDLSERRTVDGELKATAKDLGLPELQKKNAELSQVARGLSGDQNALTQALSVMELDKAAKGGTATVASLGAIQNHFGGSMDKLAGMLQQAQNGQLAPGQLAILRDAVAKAQAATRAEATEKHDAWQRTVRQNPLYAQDPKVREVVDAHSDANFGQFGFKRAPAAASGPSGAPPKLSGADAETMLKASREGDHRFDAILSANHLL